MIKFPKLIPDFLDKKDAQQIRSLRFHYERHLHSPERFKEVMRDIYTIAVPEVLTAHGVVIDGAYFCTREQLLIANGDRHSDWGPFPKTLTGATFVTGDDGYLKFHPGQLHPVVPTPPAPKFRFEDTILGSYSLAGISPESPGSLASLLSAARSEYLVSGDTEGRFMTATTKLFNDIAAKAYGGCFVWSKYNLAEWKKFVASGAASDEGGSCVFSCETDGDYSSAIHNTFKGLFLGVPTGMYPYSISVRHGIAQMDTNELRAWVTEGGFATV